MYPDIYQYMTFIVGFPPSVPPNSSPVYRLQTRMYKNTIYSNPHTPRAATKNDLDQQIPHPIRLYASRREKKGLKSSRDKNARHKREWKGAEEPASYVTPDLSCDYKLLTLTLTGARETRTKIAWDGNREKNRRILVSTRCLFLRIYTTHTSMYHVLLRMCIRPARCLLSTTHWTKCHMYQARVWNTTVWKTYQVPITVRQRGRSYDNKSARPWQLRNQLLLLVIFHRSINTNTTNMNHVTPYHSWHKQAQAGGSNMTIDQII